MNAEASRWRSGLTVHGRYRLERFLGRGAFGEVWAAEDTTLARRVALKFTAPEKLAQLRQEAAALAQMRHEHVVLVYDVVPDPETPVLVMEYVEGESLRQRMARESPVPVEEAVAIARAVLAALEHAHGRGILHRDVKPENVLLGADGVVRLGDFGLGKLTETEISMLSMRSMVSARSPEGSLLRSGEGRGPAREAASVAGTLAYMAPEQKRGEEDARSDVFAVGVLLYDVLCSRRPELRFKDPSAHNADVPAWLDEAVLRALEPEPNDRHATAREMREALEGRPEPARVVWEPEPAPPPPPTPRVVLPAGLTTDLSRAGVQLPSGSSWPSGAVVNQKDASVLVLVPAGEAIFGSREGQGNDEERPQFRAILPGYHIGVTEVTNAQYKRFVDATGHRPPTQADFGATVWAAAGFPPSKADYPVVCVSWADAKAYCEWAGGWLPSELEWEKAARGTDGRVYPWGSQWDESCCRGGENCDSETTAPVGSHPSGASPYGLFDMAGNVWEWCADWYDWDAYVRYKASGYSAPNAGSERVLRGGCWNSNAHACRSANRCHLDPAYRHGHVGFRVARDA